MFDKIKLFVFDFDGTALGGHEPYEQFPREFASFLDNLSKSGVLWATNTTWSPKEQYEVIKRSGVKSSPAFLAGQTGRLLAKVINGKVVFDSLHGKMIRDTDEKFRKKNHFLINSTLKEIIDSNLFEQFSYNDFKQNIITYVAKRGMALQARKVIHPLLGSGEFYLWEPGRKSSNSLLPCYMNKGEILRIIQDRLKISPENTAVAGDATNDLHMFDPCYATNMFCPDNAHSSIKKIVRKNNGVVSKKKYSWGVIDSMENLLNKGVKLSC